MLRTVDRLRAARRDQRGFTLIELLIVIVILGILAAIVVFSVKGITDRGDKSACKANVATAQTAVEAYYAQEGEYPDTLGDLVPEFIKSDPTTVDAKQKVAYDSGTGTVSPAAGSACAAATP